MKKYLGHSKSLISTAFLFSPWVDPELGGGAGN